MAGFSYPARAWALCLMAKSHPILRTVLGPDVFSYGIDVTSWANFNIALYVEFRNHLFHFGDG